MFNYECFKNKGTVLGTCIDGFLFGACCRLPTAKKTLVDNFVVSSAKPVDEVTTVGSLYASQESDLVSIFIEKLKAPESTSLPSIILANGSIIPLEAIQTKPYIPQVSDQLIQERRLYITLNAVDFYTHQNKIQNMLFLLFFHLFLGNFCRVPAFQTKTISCLNKKRLKQKVEISQFFQRDFIG